MVIPKKYFKMKMKSIVFSLVFVLVLLSSMSNVNAEVYLWEKTYLNYDTSIVNQHGYIQFEDTSERGIGKNKDIDLLLWYEVEALPYNLTAVGFTGEVDYCNLTVMQTENEYDSLGDYVNFTTTTTSYFFQNSSLNSTKLFFKLRDRDNIVFDFRCHQTDPTSLYPDSSLFGRVASIYIPAYECEGCKDFTVEELSNEIDRTDQKIIYETDMYNNIQSVIGFNWRLWTILLWLSKLAFLMIAVSMIFAGVYYIYKFLKQIEGNI